MRAELRMDGDTPEKAVALEVLVRSEKEKSLGKERREKFTFQWVAKTTFSIGKAFKPVEEKGRKWF